MVETIKKLVDYDSTTFESVINFCMENAEKIEMHQFANNCVKADKIFWEGDLTLKQCFDIAFKDKGLYDVLEFDEDNIDAYNIFCRDNSYYDDEYIEMYSFDDYLDDISGQEAFSIGLEHDKTDYNNASYFKAGADVRFYTTEQVVENINNDGDFRVWLDTYDYEVFDKDVTDLAEFINEY